MNGENYFRHPERKRQSGSDRGIPLRYLKGFIAGSLDFRSG